MYDYKTRPNRGASILKKVSDYTVVDIETTGLNPGRDEILEIGAIRVRNNQIVDKYHTLSKPKYPIPPFITDINGITDEMVENADSIEAVLPGFIDFLDNDIILGFRTSFDVNFLYDECKKINYELTNDFIDIRRISKRVLPNFQEETGRRYRLTNFISYFKFGIQEHRALSDCNYTKMLYDKLNEIAESNDIDYSIPPKREEWNAKDIKRQNTDITLFQGEKFVFTGKLAYMQRKEAMQYVVDYGGTVGDHLTKDTNYLVMGTQDYSRLAGDKSKKQLQAEKFISLGEDINIITEDVFYDMINYVPKEHEEDNDNFYGVGIVVDIDEILRRK